MNMGKRKDYNLLGWMKKVPGGLIIVPLLISVTLSTLFPKFFEIGGFTTGLFKSGQPALMGLFLILCGSAIDIKQVGMPLYKGTTLTAIKFAFGVILGVSVAKIFGQDGFLGITPMVMIAAMTNSGGALFLSLSSQFGDATDSGAISVLSLNDGPFFTLVALGATGLASIPFMALVATVIPLLIGFAWGNLDSGFKSTCEKAMPIVCIFMTFPIGATISFSTLIKAGMSGIILGIISALSAFVFYFVFNLFLKKKDRNAMGAAIGTTAVNSAMTPAAVANIDPAMAPYTEMATAQCATAAIISTLACPIITAYLDKRMRRKKLGKYSELDKINEINVEVSEA